MRSRTIYALIIGVSALLVAFAALLPWAEVDAVSVEDHGRSFSIVTSGSELLPGALTLLLSSLLIALVIWFWVDRGQKRVRLAAFLMAVAAVLLCTLAAFSLADLERFLPGEFRWIGRVRPVRIVTREGVYLTAAAAAAAAVASVAAMMLYRPGKDQPAPALQAAALPLFLGLPAAVYLVLAAWTEVDLSFPRMAIQLYEVGGESATFDIGRKSTTLALLGERFRHFVTPLALVALIAGVGIGFARGSVRRAPILASALVVLAYLGFLVFEVAWGASQCPYSLLGDTYGQCYNPPGLVERLATPGGESGDIEEFSLDVQVLWLSTVIVVLSIWAGVGVTEVCRGEWIRLPRLGRTGRM